MAVHLGTKMSGKSPVAGADRSSLPEIVADRCRLQPVLNPPVKILINEINGHEVVIRLQAYFSPALVAVLAEHVGSLTQLIPQGVHAPRSRLGHNAPRQDGQYSCKEILEAFQEIDSKIFGNVPIGDELSHREAGQGTKLIPQHGLHPAVDKPVHTTLSPVMNHGRRAGGLRHTLGFSFLSTWRTWVLVTATAVPA